MALMWDELPGGGVVKVKAKAKQAQPRRQKLLLDPAAIAVMARRGLVRVNVVKLAQVSKVSRPTIERWLRGESLTPPRDNAIRRACGLPTVHEARMT